jgi:hypothetical protein
VAWPLTQRLKLKGGLGIKNLQVQNDARLLKQLHKFYRKEDIPWVQQIWFKHYNGKVPHAHKEVGSFWWKDIFSLFQLYQSVTSCVVGDGTSVLFLKDNWSGENLMDCLPHLVQFAKHPNISAKDAADTSSIDELFLFPLAKLLPWNLTFSETSYLSISYPMNLTRESSVGATHTMWLIKCTSLLSLVWMYLLFSN